MENAELTVRLPRKDVLRAGVVTVYIGPAFWVIRAIFFAAIFAGELGMPEHTPFAALALAATATLIFEAVMLTLGLILGLLRLRGGERSGTLGQHRYAISEEGLIEETLANKSLHRWQVVGRPIHSGAFVMIPVRGVGYHLLPIRDEDPQMAHLLEEIEARIAPTEDSQADQG